MKFALVDFVEQREQLPLKHSFIRRAPERIQDWYVQKTLPYIQEELDIGGVAGVQLWLPMKRSAAMADQERAAAIADKILENVFPDVGIVALPPWFHYDLPEGLAQGDGKRAMPFFIKEILLKSLNIIKKELKSAELLILAGDRKITDVVLSRLYPQVNFLTILCGNAEDYAYYSEKAEMIFDDTGLNLQILQERTGAVKSADFIVSTGPDNARHMTWFKKGGVYVELNAGAKNRSVRAIMEKRPDILAVDDLILSLNGRKIDLTLMDMIFYTACKEYRSAFTKRHRDQTITLVANLIKKQEIKIYGFKANHQEIAHEGLKNFLAQAGLR